MIVVRVSKADNQTFMNSRPCENCIDLIKKVGIKNVIYSTENNNLIKQSIEEIEQTNTHYSFGYKYMISHIYPNRFPDITARHTKS